MSLNNQIKNQHLMWRAGFGPAVEQLGDLSKFSPKQFYKALVNASDKKPEYINVADEYLQVQDIKKSLLKHRIKCLFILIVKII